MTCGIAAPPGVSIDPRLVIAESMIDGRGLFFAQDVPAGTVVIRLGGTLVTSARLAEAIAAADADPSAPYVDAITIHDDAHLVLPPGTPVHFGNHSCDPTLWHVGPYELATRRDVSAGEEATIDYATHSGGDRLAMVCCCGSPACRGVITSDDWRRQDLQATYQGHWVPALQARIDSQRS